MRCMHLELCTPYALLTTWGMEEERAALGPLRSLASEGRSSAARGAKHDVVDSRHTMLSFKNGVCTPGPNSIGKKSWRKSW